MNARFNIYWSGTHVQMSEIRGLMPHQRINHFPRSLLPPHPEYILSLCSFPIAMMQVLYDHKERQALSEHIQDAAF